MIRLEHLKKNDKNIECNIFPEDSKESGSISVSLQTGEVISYTLPNGYEWCRNHINHTKKALMEFAKQDKMPTKHMIMWY